MYNGAKVGLIILIAIIVSSAIGGNGCLWVGQGGQSGSDGSSGILSQPNSPLPANGAVNVAVDNVQLSWASVSRATAYDVYFGATNPPPFASAVLNTSPRTRYYIGRLTYGVTYYWRVNPKNGVETTIGPVWTFSTGSSTVPAKVSQPTPANNATGVPINTPLSWASSINATSYDVYFGTTTPPQFELNVLRTLPNTIYNPGTPALPSGRLDYDTTYYWQVNAKGSGTETAGDIWTFRTLPLPLPSPASSPNPANNATGVLVNTMLSWASDANVDSYDVYFSTNTPPDYATNVIKTPTRTLYNPGLLDYGTSYYWRVDARNGIGVTTGTNWTFTTISQIAPVQATSPNPVDGATDVVTNTVLSWATDNNTILCDVYFGTMNPPPFVNTVTLKRYNTVTLTAATKYYWRIDTRNFVGKTQGQAWSFTTMAALPPAQVTSPSPADGATNVATNTALSWAPAARATSYAVYFGATTTGWTPITTVVLSSFRLLFLASSSNYFWRVDSKNAYGSTQGNVWSFTTALSININTWVTRESIPTSRYGAIACVIANRIYLLGGNGAVNEMYDPAIDSWSSKTNMPLALSDFGAAVANNKIYLIEGSSNFEYDPDINTWTVKAGMLSPRSSTGIGAVNNKVYVLGGIGSGSYYSNEEYDPISDTWTRKADMLTPRNVPAICGLNGKIYAIGGSNPGPNKNEVFDPAMNTWNSLADMPTARSLIGIGILNGKIYLIGGSTISTGSPLSANEEYDPNTNVWTSKPAMPTARSGVTVGVVGNLLYALGGTGGAGAANKNEAFCLGTPMQVVNLYPDNGALTRIRHIKSGNR